MRRGSISTTNSARLAPSLNCRVSDRRCALRRRSTPASQKRCAWISGTGALRSRRPAEIFNDPFARSAFYQQKGLDPALTEFPAASFQQNLLLSGLSGPPPLLIEEYDRSEKLEPEDDFEEAAFARTNKAHDRLTRFETQLRRFIEERLRDAFGEDWIKHRVPGDIQKKWTEKRQKARDQGERESPLIAYADFTDYVPIITKRDNWNDVFKPFFVRQTAVQESFQRLYPIRICTMHARLITQDDELYLLVETKRILTSIGTGA